MALSCTALLSCTEIEDGVNDIDTWELYDLQEDPSEMKNLYGQPGYEEITRQLEKKLVELQQQYQDTTALALNHF